VGSAVRTDVTGASVREMLNEAEGMTKAEVTAEELALAKDSISRSLPALFETTRSAVGTLGQLFLFDLPRDYYAGLPGRLASMTAAEVFAATRRHLAPERMLVVAVGDRAQAEAQIAALKLGGMAYRDREQDGGGERRRQPGQVRCLAFVYSNARPDPANHLVDRCRSHP
jgi:zinc protease